VYCVIYSDSSDPLNNDFHLPLTYLQEVMEQTSIFLVRYNGRWMKINSREFEPERMTTDIAWMQIKEGLTPEEAYRRWFELQRRISRVLK
jgi:hypothetical protein